MKATLAFEWPDDEDAFYNAVHGVEYRDCLSELLEECRGAWKYGNMMYKPDELPEDMWKIAAEKFRDMILELANDRGLILE